MILKFHSATGLLLKMQLQWLQFVWHWEQKQILLQKDLQDLSQWL